MKNYIDFAEKNGAVLFDRIHVNLHYSYLFGGMNLNAGNPDLVELVFGD